MVELLTEKPGAVLTRVQFPAAARQLFFTVNFQCTLQASLSGTFLQTLPELVTPLKGHSLSSRSCPPVPSDNKKDVLNQCLEFAFSADSFKVFIQPPCTITHSNTGSRRTIVWIHLNTAHTGTVVGTGDAALTSTG